MANKVAVDFEKIIHTDRNRKKNEALAARIFNKDHHRSAPVKASNAVGSASLASRVGVKKNASGATGSRKARHNLSGGNDSPFTFDVTGAKGNQHRANGNNNSSALAARISTHPVADTLTGPRRQQRRAAQIATALNRSEVQAHVSPAASAAVSAAPVAPRFDRGMSIRGLAGPYFVMAQNFAPGTTAADIESAFTPVGGVVERCRLLKTHPIVIAEVVFESKEGAEAVISMFNNQTADGRVLHVYPKAGGGGGAGGKMASNPSAPSGRNNHNPTYNPSQAQTQAMARAQPASHRQGQGYIVDGSQGFDEPVEADAPDYGNGGGLYSDGYVGDNARRGRGSGNGARRR